jgi:hypothetical protein
VGMRQQQTTMSEPKNLPEPESNDASQFEEPLFYETKAALSIAAALFRPFGMKPSQIARSGEAVGVLVGELCDERHALFVHLDTQPPADFRPALEPSPEELVLARDFRATPHVLRCVLGPLDPHETCWSRNFRHDGIQHGLAGLMGATRFHDHVARSSGYARSLRGRVTVAGHLSRLGGRLSQLRLGIIPYHNELVLRLWIDDREPASEYAGYYPRFNIASRCRLDTFVLLGLSSVNGKGMFLNCWCGDYQCIMRKRKGFTVVHEGPLTLWKIDVLRGRHIYVFDRASLRREILRGVGALILARRSDPEKIVIPNPICLEEKLADARSDTPLDQHDPDILAHTWNTAM